MSKEYNRPSRFHTTTLFYLDINTMRIWFWNVRFGNGVTVDQLPPSVGVCGGIPVVQRRSPAIYFRAVTGGPATNETGSLHRLQRPLASFIRTRAR